MNRELGIITTSWPGSFKSWTNLRAYHSLFYYFNKYILFIYFFKAVIKPIAHLFSNWNNMRNTNLTCNILRYTQCLSLTVRIFYIWYYQVSNIEFSLSREASNRYPTYSLMTAQLWISLESALTCEFIAKALESEIYYY